MDLNDILPQTFPNGKSHDTIGSIGSRTKLWYFWYTIAIPIFWKVPNYYIELYLN